MSTSGLCWHVLPHHDFCPCPGPTYTHTLTYVHAHTHISTHQGLGPQPTSLQAFTWFIFRPFSLSPFLRRSLIFIIYVCVYMDMYIYAMYATVRL